MRTGSRNIVYKSFNNFFNDYKPKRGAIEDTRVIIYEDKHKWNTWKKYLE